MNALLAASSARRGWEHHGRATYAVVHAFHVIQILPCAVGIVLALDAFGAVLVGNVEVCAARLALLLNLALLVLLNIPHPRTTA